MSQPLPSRTWNTLSNTAITNQLKVAVSGTAVQFPASAGPFTAGLVITANNGNAASVTIGGSTVTNTIDGTGNGYILQPGASIGVAVNNTNKLYLNGTAGDAVSYIGS